MSKKILIFLSIALFLYLVDWLLNNDERMINVSDNEIDFLISTWNDQMQRPPNQEELKIIIDNYIQNEVLYREALTLNLDRGDIIVKRRLSENPKTLEDLSQEYNVSRERIRQIETRAFEKLQEIVKNKAIELKIV